MPHLPYVELFSFGQVSMSATLSFDSSWIVLTNKLERLSLGDILSLVWLFNAMLRVAHG